jgi:hypothetical protein
LALLIWVRLLCQPGRSIDRNKVRQSAIRYIELENNKRWGTFVDARDTLYIDGCLFIFDTVKLQYRRVATVTIHYVTN